MTQANFRQILNNLFIYMYMINSEGPLIEHSVIPRHIEINFNFCISKFPKLLPVNQIISNQIVSCIA